MIVTFLRNLIGSPPPVPSTTSQWDYGKLIEYTMACVIVLVCVCLLFTILRVFFRKAVGKGA